MPSLIYAANGVLMGLISKRRRPRTARRATLSRGGEVVWKIQVVHRSSGTVPWTFAWRNIRRPDDSFLCSEGLRLILGEPNAPERDLGVAVTSGRAVFRRRNSCAEPARDRVIWHSRGHDQRLHLVLRNIVADISGHERNHDGRNQELVATLDA